MYTQRKNENLYENKGNENMLNTTIKLGYSAIYEGWITSDWQKKYLITFIGVTQTTTGSKGVRRYRETGTTEDIIQKRDETFGAM